MANERDLSTGQRHFPEREGSKSSLGQICCCVGGHQKQKLIDSMLLANQSLVKQVKMLEDEKKLLKQDILKRDKTVLQATKDINELQQEKAELLEVVEKQRIQLADWHGRLGKVKQCELVGLFVENMPLTCTPQLQNTLFSNVAVNKKA